jgi:hypothetical protein
MTTPDAPGRGDTDLAQDPARVKSPSAGKTMIVSSESSPLRGRLTRRCRTSLPRLQTNVRSIGLGSKVSHRNVVRDSHLGSIGIERCQRPDNDEFRDSHLGGPDLPSNARRTSAALDQDAVGRSGCSPASAAPAREGPSPVISRTPTSKVKYDQTHPRMTEN